MYTCITTWIIHEPREESLPSASRSSLIHNSKAIAGWIFLYRRTWRCDMHGDDRFMCVCVHKGRRRKKKERKYKRRWRQISGHSCIYLRMRPRQSQANGETWNVSTWWDRRNRFGRLLCLENVSENTQEKVLPDRKTMKVWSWKNKVNLPVCLSVCMQVYLCTVNLIYSDRNFDILERKIGRAGCCWLARLHLLLIMQTYFWGCRHFLGSKYVHIQLDRVE